MIKVYGKVNCSKCQLLKNILDEKNVNYEYIDDLKTLMMVASKARIMSAPIVEKLKNLYNGTILRGFIMKTMPIEEIKTQLIKVSNDLEVNLSDLENYIDLIKKESSLKEIQETLITQVVNLISFENPDWAYVAGQLLMLKTQGEVLSNRGFAYENFSLTLKTLIEKNIYDSSLNSYSQEEMKS